MTTPAPPPPDNRAWMTAHVARLRDRIDRLARREARAERRGTAGAERAKECSDAADRLERRISRLLRGLAHLDAQEERRLARLRRLGKSKRPQDRVELILGACDELAADLALQVAEEALRRARGRTGDTG
jgi:hypothetical protein